MAKEAEQRMKSEASRGKNEPLAKSVQVTTNQNGEVRPSRAAARKQPGTDAAKGKG